jgi:type III secretion protein R
LELGRAAAWVAIGAGLPVALVAATAFAKIAVVLSILRGGLGVPGVLPALVTTALAAALTALVMAPVARSVEAALPEEPWADPGGSLEAGWPPVRAFLDRNTRAEDRAAVAGVAQALAGADRMAVAEGPEVRVAAFLISELSAAFRMGVLLLLPFLVIDLLCANTLAVVGFATLPPTLVALPFKLLLFVAADGWALLLRGLAGSYAS